MKKSDAAFEKFIDTKYIPLEQKYKIAIAVILVLIPIVLFFFIFFQPNATKITTLNTQKDGLNKEIADLRAKQNDLPRLRRELAESEKLFNEAAVLLPKEKEIPQLLKDISSLGQNADLEFLTFKPLPDIPKDFYAELPISINVRGPYHNMGSFLDQVSKLGRIVTVSNIKMSAPTLDRGEMLLDSDCTLVTYRFTNVELPKQDTKKK
ncbi:MAG: type 4a pilus biogenesis protein PilO [Desulfobulbaceae bacterium]|nr:MAG: type 4a pilus biogenesis protein PilO [Desulfobulbaceae bacterium]